jgi:hypothetical protein
MKSTAETTTAQHAIDPATRELITYASAYVEKLFRRWGCMSPIYHMIHPDGRHEVVPAPTLDKDMCVAIMRAYFVHAGITRYVYVDECWRVAVMGPSTAEIEAVHKFCNERGVSQHPDRVEAVMFMAEDARGHTNAFRMIERPARGKPKLGPLEFDPITGKLEGRIVGLLPRAAVTN